MDDGETSQATSVPRRGNESMTISQTRPEYNPSEHDLLRLSAYLDNQLAADERAEIEARLRIEPALRATLDELETTIVLLRRLPSVEPPRSFTLDPAAVKPRRSWSFWLPGLLQAGGLMAALMFVVAVTANLMPGPSSEEQVAVGPMTTTDVTGAMTADSEGMMIHSDSSRSSSPAAETAPDEYGSGSMGDMGEPEAVLAPTAGRRAPGAAPMAEATSPAVGGAAAPQLADQPPPNTGPVMVMAGLLIGAVGLWVAAWVVRRVSR